MKKNKVLYISYTGMGEALGASQVLNYLVELSKDYSIFLISLEKKNDLDNQDKMKQISDRMHSNNINWYPLKCVFGVKGYIPDYLNTYRVAKRLINEEDIVLLHCRSYRAAIVAYYLKKKHHFIDYIFDTRGFWFDEKADVGTISKHGMIYKILKKFEKKIYLSAFHITVLSNVGKNTIVKGELFDGNRKEEDITMIPTCVDLKSFKQKTFVQKDKITIGYVGNVIGWYDFDKTVEALVYIKKQVDCNILFLNKGQHGYIEKKMSDVGFHLGKDFQIEAVDFNEISLRMAEIDISLFFIHPFFSKRASAATKMGELLSVGIPIITNANVGDHEYIIDRFHVGQIVNINRLHEYDYYSIFEELCTVQVSNNCRTAAETYFSLTKGVKCYSNIYNFFFHD